MQTASKKVINGWAMYDWANSAYSLIITSAIFPAYYTAIAPAQVHMFGRVFDRSALASYAISFSFLLIACISPILSSIADYKGNKKAFMQFFTYVGSAACCSIDWLLWQYRFLQCIFTGDCSRGGSGSYQCEGLYNGIYWKRIVNDCLSCSYYDE